MTSRSEKNQGYSPKGLKQRDKMVANGYDPRTLLPSEVDGRPVYDRELDDYLNGMQIMRKALGWPESPTEQEARAAIAEAWGWSTDALLNAYRFKQETLKAIFAGGSVRVRQVADRWASGSPKKVKEMEAAGTLLPRLKEQAELENSTISDARVGGAMNDTPDSEILALYDIPALPD